MTAPMITRDNLPQDGWKKYRKTQATDMRRMDGPFRVRTQEGEIGCPDGFLAVDSRGWPYPIAAEEHDRIYAQVCGGDAIPITGVWLRKHNERVEVLIEVGGVWRVVVDDDINASTISHITEVGGLEKCPVDPVTAEGDR